ncbi:MAG: sigma-70 family RNA polymerase sigma factor [Bacteroidales bacterium]|jgi:RNA polymerase sigma-70 factor (ECF subfamily)|nr:sigma-70 family RNA polymerase sigma factor [Bacteroidales bacterium]MDD4067729.1 sigma-70 family RNA polymerase sigma factor [Bacteroidales bacterium]MDD4739842.1 sigma-70 family RNA polymerase sigma factor [Bacteroidales bacterium]MDY4789834.1 sigma-70 family RNA polymerase sigma factor [Bacteroidales bacterium]NCC19264.1 sigma-70 family RNA polymerase sigma factor [Bacteroidia bacterium]
MEVSSTNLTEKAIRDYQLVCQARDHGNQKAYADLMNTYREPIYYMLLKMTNSSTDADDLTIEAFGKAFKSLSQYTPEYAFSTWLFRIATNNCIDFIRKKRAKMVSIDNIYTSSDGEQIGIDIASETLDPEEKIIEKQKIIMMREIVSRLKPHYRTLIELRYFDELSYEEIAQELNLPLGTVKAKLFRARDLLYNIFKESEDKI